MATERRRRSEWARLVRELERSGLPAAEFAARRGVNARTLVWWRWRTRSEPVGTVASAPSFVPIVVSTAAVEGELAVVSGAVEVGLPNGVTLRFEHRLDVDGVRELVMACGAA